MSNSLFYFFAALTLLSAGAVVFLRNAVAAALSFFVSLCCTGVLFVMLDAYLLAFMLILVYAGAVVALFLFIIMLLDMQGGTRKPFTKASMVASAIAGALLLVGVGVFAKHSEFAATAATLPADSSFSTDLKVYGASLFTTYLLPVQVIGFLLLIAMLGVIVLSKRFDGAEDIQ
ncbi:NADH-quinone oxidoreductase subunit J [Opitutaceae bacterium EW11]|nr:NADH-quinone oxidoreductase subunit J [Opitutaceae bacterium EW11]